MQLSIVYSIGKTASTSLFSSWGSNPACLPVLHTHDMRFFCAVDRIGSPFVEHVRSMKNVRVFGVRCPEYLPKQGYTEFRFAIPQGVALSDAFPHSLFSSTKIIGVIRDPVHRRVSQFLNDTTLESVNAYMDTNAIQERQVTAENTVAALIRVGPSVTDNRLLTAFIEVVTGTGRLPRVEDLAPVFQRFYCGCDMEEYLPYLRRLCAMFPTMHNLDCFRTHGFQVEQRGSSCLMLVAMESLAKLQGRVSKYMGIAKPIRHDRQIERESTFVDGTLAEIKRELIARTTLRDLYPAGSLELEIVQALGFK